MKNYHNPDGSISIFATISEESAKDVYIGLAKLFLDDPLFKEFRGIMGLDPVEAFIEFLYEEYKKNNGQGSRV